MAKPTDRRGYVYVLCFADTKLAHAEHYTGCTTDLRGRLATHAIGRGARLTKELHARGIGWKLGAVGECSITAIRRIERQVKDWHGPRRFCECCTPEALRIPGTTPYPLESIPFPTHSGGLKSLALQANADVCYRFATASDPIDLLEGIKRLMQADKDALGFIPVGGTGGLSGSITAGRVLVAECYGQVIGFCAFTETEGEVKIHQTVVMDSQRGCGIGAAMVNRVRMSRPAKLTSCKVRWDLVANEFWERIGFQCIGRATHETSGAQLNQFAAAPVNGDESNGQPIDTAN